MFKFLRKLFI